jgi:prepilin-type N-terminal cleavage/methylation domain-containing protein
MRRGNLGFTLVELLMVMTLMAVLAAVGVGKSRNTAQFEVMAARDQLLTCLASARQLATSQNRAVRLSVNGDQVRVYLDANGDGSFAAGESHNRPGLASPLSLPRGVSVSPITINYDRLGGAAAGSIALQKGAYRAAVTLAATGYAY